MLLGVISNKCELEKLNPYLDGIVVYSNDFSSFSKNGFKKDEIKEIISKTDKKVFIDISFMLEDIETLSITSFINEFKDLNVSFIYSDLGIHQILKEIGIENRGIYNPNTLITNSYDMNFYLKNNMESIGLSLEIPLTNLKEMLNKKEGKVFMKVFGAHPMFHSKRHLLSVYKEVMNLDFDVSSSNLKLKELKRDDFYPILETKRGTIIFRSYFLSYLKEINNLDIDYIFLENLFLDFDTYLEVIKIFYSAINKLDSLENLESKFNELNIKVEDGFKFKDTVYQKEEF